MREDEQRMMRVTPSQSAAVMRSFTRLLRLTTRLNNRCSHWIELLSIWSVGEASESVDTAGLKQENTAAGR